MSASTPVHNAITELAERYGWEYIATEMLGRMSADDARDFLSYMEDAYGEDEPDEYDCDDSDDAYALASAGWGTDEDYGG